jgi:hypothetical protein
MEPGLRRLGLLVAGALVVLVDVALHRFDLLSPLVPDTLPKTFFAAVNSQLTDVVRTLRSSPPPHPSIALLGNSQMDLGVRPLPELRADLARAGAAKETSLVPLFVYASAITDAEVVARDLDGIAADLVVLGVGAPDVGASLEHARSTPVVRTLDVGFFAGPVPPADLEARLDRWVRTVWLAYRYRTLFADLLFPGEGAQVPRAFYDQPNSKDEFFAAFRGPERAREIAALRPGFERGDDWGAAAAYVEALQGPAYLAGLRERWRSLEPAPVQLEALRALAGHVQRAGSRLVIVLVPENPVLELDPEVGREVRARSDAAAAAVEELAGDLGVTVIDLRRGFEPAGFLDLNHLFFQHGGMGPRLARELAARGLVATGS